MKPESLTEKSPGKETFSHATRVSDRAELDYCRDEMLTRISHLERKVEEGVELLHLWKNEAHAYRLLLERVIAGNCSLEDARKAVSKSASIHDAQSLLQIEK